MTNFEISITINGATGSFVIEAEKKAKIMTNDKKEAIKLFNQQWNALARFSTPSSDGKVVLTLDEKSPDLFAALCFNLKTERFSLTGRLLCSYTLIDITISLYDTSCKPLRLGSYKVLLLARIPYHI